MTLFLPEYFPKSETVHNYMFGHNETHRALVLDYGSVLNHHNSANARAIYLQKTEPQNIHFQVRAGFLCGNYMF